MDSQRFLFNHLRDGNVFVGNGNFVFQESKMMMSVDDTSKTRPFFSSAEELIYDEEYLDEQLPEKKRRLTPEQVNFLEKSFEVENRLEPDRKNQLAKKLDLQPRQVAVWFQNRRARWKTKQLESNYDQLKSSYDSLASKYAAVLDENGKLKAQLLCLTEKSRATEPADGGEPPGIQLTVKVEDRISTGSDGSAVVDEDCPQLFDSGDSCFPDGGHQAADGVYSEEDDGSDGGGSYFSDVFAAAEPIGWLI